MINKKKILFWDRFFWTKTALFIIPIVLSISASEHLKTNEIFYGAMFVSLLLSAIMSIIFAFGMSYNAYKIKRYGWMVVNLILGELFLIIFYFFILRKQVENGDSDETQN